MTTKPVQVLPVVPSAALASVPSKLREQLFAAFNEVLRNYREGRWEPSELNGGKLCEVVYTILRRVLDAKMTAKDKALVLLYHAGVWVDEETLRGWVEYSNTSLFRKMLLQFHKKKLVEYDSRRRRAMLSPTGIDYVETKIALSV